MMDPMSLMLGTERARQLSQSALPHAPVVAEARRARRRRRPLLPLATALRLAADALDGAQTASAARRGVQAGL